MTTVQTKSIVAVLVIAGVFALLLPALQRQMAIYQFRNAFPGLFRTAAPSAKPIRWHVRVDRVDRTTGHLNVVYSVVNDIESRDMRYAFVDCTALDFNARPIAIGHGVVNGTRVGQTSFGDAIIVLPKDGSLFNKVSCVGQAD